MDVDKLLGYTKDSTPEEVVNVLKTEADMYAKLNDNLEGEGYLFKTVNGIMRVKPSDIIEALKEQSKIEDEDIQPPETDLQGWGIINATDENGVSRPLLLMRVLPSANIPTPYYQVEKDDKIMSELVLKRIYKLTPKRILWIHIRSYLTSKIYRIRLKLKRIYKIIKEK